MRLKHASLTILRVGLFEKKSYNSENVYLKYFFHFTWKKKKNEKNIQ